MTAADETRPLPRPAGDDTVAIASPSPDPSPATDELRVLLRKRLLVCAVLMSVLLVANLLVLGLTTLPAGGWEVYTACSFAVGPVCGALLWARPRLSVRVLRLIELVIFGAMSTMWALVHAFYYPVCRLPDPPIWFGIILGYAVSLPWACLIVAYGVLIPNTWRRCVAVVGVMAVTPLVVSKLNGMSAEATGRHPEVNYYLVMGSTLASLAGLAVFASSRIETLRRAAVAARQLGPYTLVRVLGRGGMGEVHLAQHRLLKRPCAVKLIRPEKAGHAATVRRFEREVEAAARLTHPAAVHVYDYGREADGTFYYVMEYLPGLTLREVVKRAGPLPAGRVVAVLRQVCGALSEAHGLGLVHRDIKPANVMACRLGGRETAKILDFGLVSDVRSEDQLTKDGSILGTPHYLSPELARGQAVGPASDLYSLGATAYYLLTGRPPFVGDNVFALLHAHQTEPPPPPSTVRPGVPADVEAVVLRLLAKEPTERYGSAAEAETALAGCAAAGDWTDAHAAEWWARVGVADASPVDPTVTAAGL